MCDEIIHIEVYLKRKDKTENVGTLIKQPMVQRVLLTMQGGQKIKIILVLE